MMRLYGIPKLNRMPGTTGSPHSMQIRMKKADHRWTLEKYRYNAAARYNGM
jgi:hypothetical protein